MRQDRRKNFRIEWKSPSTIYDVDQHLERPCIVSDFSNGGAKLTMVDASTIPDQFILTFASGRRGRRKCRVLWRSKGMLGVEFADAITSTDEPEATRDAKPMRGPNGRVSISYGNPR